MTTENSDSARVEHRSFEETRRDYAIWRWRIEQPSSMRLVGIWQRVGSSGIDPATQVALVNVAWAAAALERAWAVLVEDACRMERVKREGAPAIMHLLSGPYRDSLSYLLGMSLWVDLGDVLVAYRTVVDRFRRLIGSARRGYLQPHKVLVGEELQALQGRRLLGLSAGSISKLADRVLHESWHPGSHESIAFEMHWKGDDGDSVDFAHADVMDELEAILTDTIAQIGRFFDAVLPPGPRHSGHLS